MSALEAIVRIVGRGVYVPGDDIDTDRIIPARYLKCVTFDGLGEGLFRDVRFAEDGTPKGHPIDDPRFAGASILLSDSNFGCGSSREHAPQALYRHGFRAIIAESFADIFFGNSVTLGMPPVEAEAEVIGRLAAHIEAAPGDELVIDLRDERVSVGGESFAVKLPPTARDALLGGRWDAIAELLAGGDEITRTAARLPYLG